MPRTRRVTRLQCAEDLGWRIQIRDEDRALILYRQRNAPVTVGHLRKIAENFSDRFDFTWRYTVNPHLPGAWIVECKTDELNGKVDAFLAKPFLEFLTVVVTDHSTADLLVPLAVPGDTIICDVGARERYDVRNGVCATPYLAFVRARSEGDT